MVVVVGVCVAVSVGVEVRVVVVVGVCVAVSVGVEVKVVVVVGVCVGVFVSSGVEVNVVVVVGVGELVCVGVLGCLQPWHKQLRHLFYLRILLVSPRLQCLAKSR